MPVKPPFSSAEIVTHFPTYLWSCFTLGVAIIGISLKLKKLFTGKSMVLSNGKELGILGSFEEKSGKGLSELFSEVSLLWLPVWLNLIPK